VEQHPELLKALFDWQNEKGYTDAKLCRLLAINKNTIINWRKYGLTSSRSIEKVQNFLRYGSVDLASEIEPQNSRIPTYPIISDATAATVNRAYMSAIDFATEYAEDYVSFSKGCPGDFVIKVSGDSMAPWYPEGTLLLVRPNVKLVNGDRVVAVLADGTTLFKIFGEDESSIFLFSENRQDGQDYMFSKTDFNGVRALYLVVQSMRDERALDSAKERQGIRSEISSRIMEMKKKKNK
jgi:SOS-response transcriptional repressor LexA